MWRVSTGKLKGTLLGHTAIVWSVACSPDGKSAASASYDTTVKLWDMATLKNTATLKGHDDIILTVAYSPDGKTLASASRDKTVKLWDVASGKNLATLTGHTLGAASVAYCPDGKHCYAKKWFFIVPTEYQRASGGFTFNFDHAKADGQFALGTVRQLKQPSCDGLDSQFA